MEDKTTKAVTAMVVAIMGVLMMSQVVLAMTPQKNYCCPVCGECFFTYDELYAHFTTQHPSEPIDIIWT